MQGPGDGGEVGRRAAPSEYVQEVADAAARRPYQASIYGRPAAHQNRSEKGLHDLAILVGRHITDADNTAIWLRSGRAYFQNFGLETKRIAGANGARPF